MYFVSTFLLQSLSTETVTDS